MVHSTFCEATGPLLAVNLSTVGPAQRRSWTTNFRRNFVTRRQGRELSTAVDTGSLKSLPLRDSVSFPAIGVCSRRARIESNCRVACSTVRGVRVKAENQKSFRWRQRLRNAAATSAASSQALRQFR